MNEELTWKLQTLKNNTTNCGREKNTFARDCIILSAFIFY